ncbi:hypothetical protein [Arthrobacter sp. MW3 TE3886]|uniref:hypothetical protein n=1 Tax=Arthrobacter sp. MW3 TE3886 TaxID=3156254 RepID=UPI003514198A
MTLRVGLVADVDLEAVLAQPNSFRVEVDTDDPGIRPEELMSYEERAAVKDPISTITEALPTKRENRWSQTEKYVVCLRLKNGAGYWHTRARELADASSASCSAGGTAIVGLPFRLFPTLLVFDGQSS